MFNALPIYMNAKRRATKVFCAKSEMPQTATFLQRLSRLRCMCCKCQQIVRRMMSYLVNVYKYVADARAQPQA